MKLRKMGRDRDNAVLHTTPGDLRTLVVHLIGRIVLIEHDGVQHALFLDAQHNPALEFPRHRAMLRASIEDVDQDGANLAFVSLADADGRVQVLWDLAGHDLHFTGLDARKAPVLNVDRLADLRSAYQAVDPAAQWKTSTELVGTTDPRAAGIVARLSLKGFTQIDTMFFDAGGVLRGAEAQTPTSLTQARTFLPGEHVQDAHAVIRCTASFRELAAGRPTLVMREFGGAADKTIAFDDTTPLQMTLSNLCNCVGTDSNKAVTRVVGSGEAEKTLVMEDEEFAVYYELLLTPPAVSERPLPFVSKEGAGGGGVVECVPAARLRGRG